MTADDRIHTWIAPKLGWVKCNTNIATFEEDGSCWLLCGTERLRWPICAGLDEHLKT
ncbi:hypothetical protein Syun_006851 [Stephania yunnanensis]|uniref:Uncharacterized protein n=1 Tax=Stephania yunnanensis TaxID=152371 RepID=A0AAP0PYW1_9MAGN